MLRTYKVSDIAKAVQREKTTIIRWERDGIIPQSRRDEKGWRYFTENEFQKIVNIAKTLKNDLPKKQYMSEGAVVNPTQLANASLKSTQTNSHCPHVESAQNSITASRLRLKKIPKHLVLRALHDEHIQNKMFDMLLKLFFQSNSSNKFEQY